MKALLVGVLFVILSGSCLYAQTIEEVSSLYNARKFEKAEQAAINLINLGVEDARLLMLLGRTLADQGKSLEAIDYLERSLKIEYAPSWVYAWSYAYLGSCSSKIGDYEKARNYLNECVKLNATKDATKTAYNILAHLGLLDSYNKWAIVETENIRFHFQDSTQLNSTISLVLRSIEKFKMIKDRFPCELPKSIDYFVWTDEKEANEILKEELGFSLPEYAVVHETVRDNSGGELIKVIANLSIQPEANSIFIETGLSVYFSNQDADHLTIAKEVVTNYEGVFSIEEVWKKAKLFPKSTIDRLGGAWMKYVYANFSKEEIKLLLKLQEYNTVKKKMGVKLDEHLLEFQKSISQ